jgi:hypothetical protein
MKRTIVAGIAAVLLIPLAEVVAGDPPSSPPTPSCSSELQRMKSLVGTWRGPVDMGQGPVEMTLQYRLIAGGSILEERCLVGTPQEMVTMYYDQNGKLALTHYCIMGNRPAMFLKSSDSKSLTFDLDPSCGIDLVKESHMHGMTIRFDDADTITTSCKAIVDGKQVEEKASQFKRVKAS